MAGPHDAPGAAQLVEAVREWIERDVLPATDGRLRFHARVAANALAVVERELDLGPRQHEAHLARLAALGVADDAELAAAIRRRDFDDRSDELRKVIAAMIVDKLLVANPAYLTDKI